MSYSMLYRKYRPVYLKDVKGQDPIVTTLRNQILSGRIGHAYLFTGTRGTGKTSVAKIFAKAVNCENPGEDGPCNECVMCKSIGNQTSMNVIEIDAASNNGVDNVREIIEEVRYSPAEGKYKVYIIDEVHMLSAGAFNALLKTLEEPPSYVIFILATTEVHKIPVTILSRCQRYDFRRIPIETITNLLKELVIEEGVEAEEKALRYVAKVADGSVRDGLSLLDQCIAFYFGQKLTYDKILNVLGAVDADSFSNMLRMMMDGDAVGCLSLIEELVMRGRELGQFVTDFVWYLRNLLLVKASQDASEMIDLSTEHVNRLKEEAERMESETILRYIRICSDLSGQLRHVVQKRVAMEIAIIKLCKPSMESDLSSLHNRILMIEKQLEQGIVINKEGAGGRNSVKKEKDKPLRSEPNVPKALSEDIKKVAREWNSIVNRLSPVIRSMMSGVTPSVGEDDQLLLLFREEMELKYFEQDEAKLREVKNAIQSTINKEVEVQIHYMPQNQIKEVVDITKLIKIPVEVE